MPTWIDDEGRLRERADDKHQFLRNIPLEFLDPWSSYDSWDAELAIKLITIGYNLDIKGYWDEAKDFPYGSTGWDSAHAYVDVYQRGMSIAKSSIAAGLLKDSDTPANWLTWAKRKGYDVKHLEHSQIALAAGTASEQSPKSGTVAAVAKPWLQVDPRDPNPEQHWYTPARHFARQLVIADTTLLTKKLILADKVSQSLAGAGIFKRGGKKKHSADTVRKAFANVNLG